MNRVAPNRDAPTRNAPKSVAPRPQKIKNQTIFIARLVRLPSASIAKQRMSFFSDSELLSSNPTALFAICHAGFLGSKFHIRACLQDRGPQRNASATPSTWCRRLAGCEDMAVLRPSRHRAIRLLARPGAGIAATCQHAREIRDTVPARLFDACFKFAFVRNPWSLQLSLYRHVLRSPTHPQHEIFAALRGFEAYIEWIGSHPNGRHKTQCDFLMDDDGAPLVDFIGRFERLPGDFARIASRLGIPAHLPHINCSGEDPDFRKFYTASTRNIVADLHRADLDAFGYEFGVEDAERAETGAYRGKRLVS